MEEPSWGVALRLLFYGIVLLVLGIGARNYIGKKYNSALKFHQRIIWFVAVLPFLAGGYDLIVSLLATGYLLFLLICACGRKYELRLYVNDGLLAITVLVLAYGVTVLWAADRGMAALGVVKFFPLLCYGVTLMQMESEQVQNIHDMVPVLGVWMVLFSFPLQFIPLLTEILAPKGRLAGFMEYPNTFALFLLVGLVLQFTKSQRTKNDIAMDMVLLFGVFSSGSRTSLLLLLFIVVVASFLRRDLKFAGAEIGLLAGVALLSFGVARLELYSAAGRYLTISAGDSTLLSRLLYFKDALPVIAGHPFGLGYLGYATVQGNIQHGVYAVTYIHNELLQMLLDIGWLPVVLLCIAFGQSFFSKSASRRNRLLMIVILGHCMMDFDLQFLCIWILLLPLLELHKGKPLILHTGRIREEIVSLLIMGLCLWLGTGDLLYQMGQDGLCLQIMPFHTEAMERQLAEISDPERLEVLANHILALNPHSPIAWSAKANVAFSRGLVEEMIQEKEQAIAQKRYFLEEYTDYFDKLYTAMQQFAAQGDGYSAQFCCEKLLDIPNMLAKVETDTDPLAWKLEHQPVLTLPERYQQRLQEAESQCKQGAADISKN